MNEKLTHRFFTLNNQILRTLVFIFPTLLIGQPYHSFIELDVEWIVVEAFEQTVTNQVQFEFEKTPEILNGHDYYRMGDYLFREEIDSGIVYVFDTVDSIDIIYYDFSLSIGDSIKSRISPSNDRVYVESIENLIVDSSARRVINFTAPDDSPECHETWIEGIGSSFGPTGPLSINYDCWHFRGYLTCFRRIINQTTLYGECAPNGLGNEKIDNDCEFFPNPTTNILAINSIAPIQQIKIISASGLLLKNVDVDNTPTYEIHLSGLPNGLYFLRIETERSTVTKKIVKTTH